MSAQVESSRQLAQQSDSQIGQVCRQCHAQIASFASVRACPACGGELTAVPGRRNNQTAESPAEIDHRGIVLPRRHAVGGVITPR